MSASAHLNDDVQANFTLRSSVGPGESSSSVTGVESQRTTTSHPRSEHGTRPERPQTSEHQAHDKPQSFHTYAYSSNVLPLRLAGGSYSRPPPANPQHGLEVADAKVPGHAISPSCAPSFSLSAPAPPPSTPDKIRCEQCGVEFAGNDKKSNLARHVRNQQTWAKAITYKCTVAECGKSYSRSDNLLKHERKCHAGLRPEPSKRKNGKKATATTPSRITKVGSTSQARRNKRPVRHNRGSGPQTPQTHAPTAYAHSASPAVPDAWQAPGVDSLALDFGNIHTSAHTDHRPSVPDVYGVGNWLPTPSVLDDPTAGETPAFKQLHHDLQQVVAPAPSQQAAGPSVQFSQHDLTHQESRWLPEQLYRDFQQAGTSIPPYQAAAGLFPQFGQYNPAAYNAAYDESCLSPYHPYPPRHVQTYGPLLSPATVSGYIGSTDMSPIPSNQFSDAASSSYPHPAYTGSTSIHGSVDPAHHSPLASPVSYHSTPLQSIPCPYATSQNISPAQESLSEHQYQAVPGFDPSFIPSQDDEVDEAFFQDMSAWSNSQDEGLG